MSQTTLLLSVAMSVKLEKPLKSRWKVTVGTCLITATVTGCLMKWMYKKEETNEDELVNKWKIAFIVIGTMWTIMQIMKCLKWIAEKVRILESINVTHIACRPRAQPRNHGGPRERARSAMGLTD